MKKVFIFLMIISLIAIFIPKSYASTVLSENIYDPYASNIHSTTAPHDTSYNDYYTYVSSLMYVTSNHVYEYLIFNDSNSTLQEVIGNPTPIYSRVKYYNVMSSYLGYEDLVFNEYTQLTFPTGTAYFYFEVQGLGIDYSTDMSNRAILDNCIVLSIDYIQEVAYDDGVDSVNTGDVYDNGYDTGYDEGYDDGFDYYVANNMYDDAYDAYYTTWYNQGRSAGLSEGNSNNIALVGFIPSILGAIFSFFFMIFSIEFLGVSILEILAGVAAIAVTLILLKIFIK